jgi:uncharacterized protein involved in type VI secretion and phage assembly
MSETTEALQHAIVKLAQHQQRRYYGKYRGIVTQNKDPDTQGRIQAKVPELFGDQETGWAMACVPFAPPSHGMLFLPEVDSNVWIEFEGGDPSRPIWSGCWWPQGKAASTKSPAVKLIETVAGHQIMLDDTEGSEAVTIKDKNGSTVTLDQSGITLASGGMKVQVSDQQVSINDGSLTVM